MDVKLLENANAIREAFIRSFVLSWEEFQVQRKAWIDRMAHTGHPITEGWYERSYWWDRLVFASSASMTEALDILREHSGPVLFMSELGEDTNYRGRQIVDFVAEADAHALAAQIEQEWYNFYCLTEKGRYDSDAFLPLDLYVFDSSMTWCAVFTHESSSPEFEDPQQAAAGRYCMICKCQARKDGKPMIPTPDYLQPYAIDPKQTGTRLCFQIQCSCGCKEFQLLEKSYTEEEKHQIRQLEEGLPNLRWHTIYSGMDTGGKPYHYIKRFGIFKKRISIPEAPVFQNIQAVKALCSQCRREILLFDSRYHGYDALPSDQESTKQYDMHFAPAAQQTYGIEIAVENDPSLEQFRENFGEPCSPEFYSNAFDWISIRGTDRTGKAKVLLDFETA
jgi:hypothetical protein